MVDYCYSFVVDVSLYEVVDGSGGGVGPPSLVGSGEKSHSWVGCGWAILVCG